MAEALQGIVVLDLTAYLAGHYGCTLLGDVGAEIIKIERPGGDMNRHYPSSLANESRQILAQGLVVEHDHPVVGKYRAMSRAVEMGISDKPTARSDAR